MVVNKGAASAGTRPSGNLPNEDTEAPSRRSAQVPGAKLINGHEAPRCLSATSTRRPLAALSLPVALVQSWPLPFLGTVSRRPRGELITVIRCARAVGTAVSDASRIPRRSVAGGLGASAGVLTKPLGGQLEAACWPGALNPLGPFSETAPDVVRFAGNRTRNRIATDCKTKGCTDEGACQPPWQSNSARPAGYRSARANVATREPPGQGVLIHPFDDRPRAGQPAARQARRRCASRSSGLVAAFHLPRAHLISEMR